MFYLEDSEDEEEVHEGSLSKTEDVHHGKAPAGILVSCIHQCPGYFACLLNLIWLVLSEMGVGRGRRGTRYPPKEQTNAFSLDNVAS